MTAHFHTIEHDSDPYASVRCDWTSIPLVDGLDQNVAGRRSVHMFPSSYSRQIGSK